MTSKERWIPIGEGPPNNGRSVLVVTSFHQMMVASWVRGKEGFQYDHEDKVTSDRITHWRELPGYP